jgi:hypothetical protein
MASWLRRRTSLLTAVSLAALVGAALILLAACDNNDEPQDVALSMIVVQQDDYDGDMVRLRGTVRFFEDPDGGHYVIEDEEQNRVQLLPRSVAEPFEDEEVTVVGEFSFSEDEGRIVEVDEIQ